MRTLNVAISDVECAKFGIKDNILLFSDFVNIIKKDIMKENMEAVVKSAENCGLSSMSMDDITSEVQAVRHAG